jgi:hypothetical protein
VARAMSTKSLEPLNGFMLSTLSFTSTFISYLHHERSPTAHS